MSHRPCLLSLQPGLMFIHGITNFATSLIPGSSKSFKTKGKCSQERGNGTSLAREAPQQEQDYFPLRAEHLLCLQQTENKIWSFQIFIFYPANKVDYTSLKCIKKKKENISLPFLLSCSLTAELKGLAEGGSDFQCFTFCSSSIPSGLALKMGQFHLLHYQICQYLGWKGLQGTFKPQPDTLHPNTHSEGSLSSTSSTL